MSAAQVNGQGAACGEEGSVYVEYSQQDITPNQSSFDTIDGALYKQHTRLILNKLLVLLVEFQ